MSTKWNRARTARHAAASLACCLALAQKTRADAPWPGADLPPADLAALLREAEANSPEIAAAAGRRAAAGAVPSQVEAPPDPVAGVSYTNAGLTESTLGEDDDTMLSLSWSQEVLHPGKLRLAGDAARRDVEVAQRRLDGVRLDVAARVKGAFAELYHADRSARVLHDSRELLATFLQTARVRYETGEGLLQNVLKAQTEIAKLDVELAKLVEERQTAQARLNALAGRTQDAPIGPALALPRTVPSIDTEALVADALVRSPEVLEKEASVRREEAGLDLARRLGRPDFLWGAAFSYRGDLDPEIGGSFGVRLPLYQKRKQAQGVVQSSHRLDSSRQEAAASRLRIAAEVRSLAARAARAFALETLYTDGVLPQAHSALESAAAAYGVGRVDFLTLLSDFGAVLTYEIDLVTQRHERVLALAALERLTARELVFAAAPGPVAGAPVEGGHD